MQINAARKNKTLTHEGGNAFPKLTPIQQLRRSVLNCLLWEKEFYEDGESIAKRIEEYSAKVSIEALAALAIEARTEYNLRHAPLLLLVCLTKLGSGKSIVSDTIAKTIQRADELTELVSLYWREGKKPLSKQIKKGLAKAFCKFDAYQLAKYDREKEVRLRDILFLVHAKPKDENQAKTWSDLANKKLPSPDTWEVSLSAGKDKKQTFERLLKENNLGYLALLRNLRNMAEAGVDEELIKSSILARKGAQRVLPFRYVAAARAAPRFEPYIDQALSEAITEIKPFPGKTVVLVDVSGSMDVALSSKSDMRRVDAAAALASLINGDIRMFSFSDKVVEVPPRRGMAGVDALISSQLHNGTALFEAIELINKNIPYNRLIVITDEQANGSMSYCPNPNAAGYMINVASNKNGVGYGKWTHIDGFSENVIRWIHEYENAT